MNVRTTISLCALLALSAMSCQIIIDENKSVPETSEPRLVTLTCEYPEMTSPSGTKVTLDESGNAGWEVGDKIVIFGKSRTKVVHELVAGDIVDPSVAIFTEDLSGLVEDDAPHVYNAAFPADDFDFYSSNSYGRARFYETNQVLMAGYLDGDKIVLQNLCAAITFKVSGDFDTYVFTGYNGTETVGYEDYLVEINNASPSYLKKLGEDYGTKGPKTSITGPVVNDGSSLNYVFIPNVADLSSGFTIKFAKNGIIKKTITSTAPLTLSHGHMVNLGLLPSGAMHDYVAIPDSEKASAEDLSASVSANCYIVNSGDASNASKVFKFRTVKGNSYVKDSSSGSSVGTVESVNILWETWNTDESVTANSVISVVDYSDGYVYFKMPETLHAGNALIAVKDSDENILWSWHIWIPETAITTGTYGISTPEMMDRNLGALAIAASTGAVSAESQGLMYQWGRKDPFVGTGTAGVRGFAAVAGTAMSKTTSAITIDYAHAHPTVFAGTGADWISDSDANLWGSSTGDKTQTDPCPPGYKVPLMADAPNLFAGSDIASATGWSYDESNYRFTVGSPVAIFPHMGYINYDGTYSRATRSVLWRAESGSAEYVYEGPGFSSGVKNSCGASVRCVAE